MPGAWAARLSSHARRQASRSPESAGTRLDDALDLESLLDWRPIHAPAPSVACPLLPLARLRRAFRRGLVTGTSWTAAVGCGRGGPGCLDGQDRWYDASCSGRRRLASQTRARVRQVRGVAGHHVTRACICPHSASPANVEEGAREVVDDGCLSEGEGEGEAEGEGEGGAVWCSVTVTAQSSVALALPSDAGRSVARWFGLRLLPHVSRPAYLLTTLPVLRSLPSPPSDPPPPQASARPAASPTASSCPSSAGRPSPCLPIPPSSLATTSSVLPPISPPACITALPPCTTSPGHCPIQPTAPTRRGRHLTLSRLQHGLDIPSPQPQRRRRVQDGAHRPNRPLRHHGPVLLRARHQDNGGYDDLHDDDDIPAPVHQRSWKYERTRSQGVPPGPYASPRVDTQVLLRIRRCPGLL